MAYTSPNLGLRIWNDNNDTFQPDQLASNLAKIDFHDHSPGRGVPIPTEGIADGAITAEKLAPGAVSFTIPDNSVTNVKMADNAIGTAELINLNVTTAKLANLAVTTGKLADDSVTSAKIVDATIQSGDIGDNQVSAAKISSAAITTPKIVDANVTTAKLADGAVTTPKIADGAVTAAKLGSGISFIPGAGSITADQLQDAATLGLSNSTATRRGKVSVSGAETRSTTGATDFQTLPTPDSVTIALPSDGLLFIGYMAEWLAPSSTDAWAKIFLNSTAIIAADETGPHDYATGEPVYSGIPRGSYTPLSSSPDGLASTVAPVGGNSNSNPPKTTGQVVGAWISDPAYRPRGGAGICTVFAAAGTYNVSIKYATSATGSVTVRNRKFWVWTMGF